MQPKDNQNVPPNGFHVPHSGSGIRRWGVTVGHRVLLGVLLGLLVVILAVDIGVSMALSYDFFTASGGHLLTLLGDVNPGP